MLMVQKALCSCFILALIACAPPEEPDDEDDFVPVDVEAILWCLPTMTYGETAEGERVSTITSAKDVGLCLCLPVGTQPVTGSELQQVMHQMALDKCVEDLEALGAVTTNCEERLLGLPADYEGWCKPDEWPPPPPV